jgi:hypothetical protein
MSGHHVTQFNIERDKLTECVRRVAPRMASSEFKRIALEKSIYETVAYFAKYMPWSMQQYRELDSILSGLLRNMSSNMRQFPADLVYIPKDSMGLGFSRLSDLVQKRKIGMMRRMIKQGGREKEVMVSLVARGLTANELHIPSVIREILPGCVGSRSSG